MVTYLVGAVLVVLLVLAVRSYFGKKYAGQCNSRCGGCPYARSCHTDKKIKG